MCLYKMEWDATPNSFVFAKAEENLYFGPKALRLGPITGFDWPLAVDRLGSIRHDCCSSGRAGLGKLNVADLGGLHAV